MLCLAMRKDKDIEHLVMKSVSAYKKAVEAVELESVPTSAIDFLEKMLATLKK